MSEESIIALISLFLGILSASICGVVFLVKQDEQIKNLLHQRITSISEKRIEDANIQTERYKQLMIHIKEIKHQIQFIEEAINDISGWAYKKGFIPKRMLGDFYSKNDNETSEDHRKD